MQIGKYVHLKRSEQHVLPIINYLKLDRETRKKIEINYNLLYTVQNQSRYRPEVP